MESQDQKFCRDCKHFVEASPLSLLYLPDSSAALGCCSPERPVTIEFHVYGRSLNANPKVARMNDGFCGEQGRHWEKRECMSVEQAVESGLYQKEAATTNPWWKFWKQEG